jgi:hypothetical protein
MIKNAPAILYLLLCAAGAYACKAKNLTSWQYPLSPWDKIVYCRDAQIMKSDTAFLMVSNRHFTSGVKNFAAEQTDTGQQHLLYISQRQDTTFVYDINSLSAGISLFSKKNWVLYTEGMGKTFTGNLQRASLMSTTYNVNVILFDYASINNELGGRKNYYFSLQNSLNSYLQYTRFLKEIQTIKNNTLLFEHVSINVFLHSMGNLMFRRMMLEGLSSTFNHQKFIDNIIFNAACVNRKNHHRWISKIDFASNIYVHFNKADRKLGGAMLISGNRKLGSKPKSTFGRHIHYMDFHEAVGNNHSYFLNIPGRSFVMSAAIQNYYRRILHGENIPFEKEFERSNIVGSKMR